jgi:hypothetical protein
MRDPNRHRAVNIIRDQSSRLLAAVRESFLYFMTALGTVTTAAGFIIGQGPVAGIVVVIGVFVILYGIVGMLGLSAIGY